MGVLENVMAGYDQRLSYGLVLALLRTPRMRREEDECRKTAIGLLDFVGLSQYANEAARFLPFWLAAAAGNCPCTGSEPAVTIAR